MLGRSLAREWCNRGINVNVVCPGYIETELNADWFAEEGGKKQVAGFPRRRLMAEEDLDAIMLMLCGDASRAAHRVGVHAGRRADALAFGVRALSNARQNHGGDDGRSGRQGCADHRRGGRHRQGMRPAGGARGRQAGGQRPGRQRRRRRRRLGRTGGGDRGGDPRAGRRSGRQLRERHLAGLGPRHGRPGDQHLRRPACGDQSGRHPARRHVPQDDRRRLGLGDRGAPARRLQRLARHGRAFPRPAGRLLRPLHLDVRPDRQYRPGQLRGRQARASWAFRASWRWRGR